MVLILALTVIIFFLLGYFFTYIEDEVSWINNVKELEKYEFSKPLWESYNERIQNCVDYANAKYGTNIVTVGCISSNPYISHVADFEVQKYCYDLSENAILSFAKDLKKKKRDM